MAEKKTFNDPLKEVDPVMEKAYSRRARSKAAPKPAPSVDLVGVEFPDLTPQPVGKPASVDLFGLIPVSVSVELGRAKINLKEAYALAEGSIIELDRLAGEPLDLVVNGQVIARGEVVALDNNYGLRITGLVARSH